MIGLSRRDRRVLRGAARLPDRRSRASFGRLSDELAEYIAELAAPLRHDADLVECEARLIVRRAGERFDGRDFPEGLAALRPGPLLSRVLTVAHAWAELTAAGTPQVAHADAIAMLRDRAGTELDPAVVRAAAQVVAEEAAFLRDPDFQPRLHRLPLPQPLRHRLAPAVLRRLASPA